MGGQNRVKMFLICFGVLIVCRVPCAKAASVESEARRPPAKFGIQLGMNVAGARLSQGFESNRRVGLAAGILVNTRLLGHFILLQPELNFVQRGSRINSSNESINAQLNYFDIPLLFKARLRLGNTTFFGLLGPKVGVLIDTDSSAPLSLSTFSMGYTLGLGLGFPFGTDREFILSARYERGLFDVDRSSREWRSEEARILAGVIF